MGWYTSDDLKDRFDFNGNSSRKGRESEGATSVVTEFGTKKFVQQI